MKLGFLLEGAGRSAADWRHPDMPPLAGTNFERHKEQALIAEDAKADLVFFADTLFIDANSPPHRITHFEAVTIMSALASVTSHIGLIGTISSTFTEPYNLARQMLSLDHISGGRAGWNLVTTDPKGPGANYGRSEEIAHNLRFKIADEYLTVIEGLWDSFEDDALVQDRENDIFMDPSKLHTLNHKGEFLSVKGPLNIHRSQQGRPVVFTATQSEDGKAFASRRVDCIFCQSNSKGEAQAFYADVKTRAEAAGRDRTQLAIMPGIKPLVAETQEEAERLYVEREMEIGIDGALKYLGRFFKNYDFSGHDLDAPFPAHLLDEFIESVQGDILRMKKAVEEDDVTLREMARRFGLPKGTFVGTPDFVADLMQEWFEADACDGFVIGETLPGQFRKFTDTVVPILQARGILKTEYPGTTLRESLGLKRPENIFVAGQAQPVA